MRFILFKGGRGGGGAGEGRDAVGDVGAHSIVARTCVKTGFGIRLLRLLASRNNRDVNVNELPAQVWFRPVRVRVNVSIWGADTQVLWLGVLPTVLMR